MPNTLTRTFILRLGILFLVSLLAGSADAQETAPSPKVQIIPQPRQWTITQDKFRFGSGVATEKNLFFLAENGLTECWEKETGKVLWQERLQGPGKKMTSWSSLSMAGKMIYAPNQSGDVFVFAADPEFRVLSTNSVDEPTNASLALSQGRVFMRTDKSLWSFGPTAN